MTSTCPNDVVSKWNKDNVGKNLKEWVRSISIEKVYKKNFKLSGENQHGYNKGKHCKTVTISRNKVFSKFDPDLYSPNITILGKVTHDDDGKNWEPTNRTFYGPVWATINDPYEWYINEKEGEISGLNQKAKLHNGFYYGVLNNKHMKIGTQVQTFKYVLVNKKWILV